ncbi:MAG TPA: sialidase family protein [Pilimelia sp.]|nr:sialidase family protein [Pilimelia sp.]
MPAAKPYRRRLGLTVLGVVLVTLGAPLPAHSAVPLTQVSADPYSDAQGQHQTEVEPDTLAWGRTIVSAFLVGRVANGGASNIGWARSADAGATWQHGFLPATTPNTDGPWTKVTDPVVAFSLRHNTWQISFIGITGTTGTHVLTSRSTNGGVTWSPPITVASGIGAVDKNWMVCDNNAASPFRGTCHTTFSNQTGNAWRIRAVRSSDGGSSWSAPVTPAGNPGGFTGSAIVRPDGAVVVAYLTADQQVVRSFRSTDGGASWGAPVTVDSVQDNVRHHVAPAPFRDWVLPSIDVDRTGRVYVSWSSCRFRVGCATNDIVISESVTGQAWLAPYRVPLDPIVGVHDHYLPGLAVAAGSGGNTARLALTYYYLHTATCVADCRANVAFASSVNGGLTWSRPTHVAAMSLARFPTATGGRMIADYISTSIVGRRAHTIVPVARPPAGQQAFDVDMYHPTGGLPVTGGPIPSI